MNASSTFSIVLAAALAAACASGPSSGPAALPSPGTPAQWRAPLPATAAAGAMPTAGNPWSAFDDAALLPLIDAARAVNPGLSAAAARIEQARAARVAAAGSLLPQVNASAGASHGREAPRMPTGGALSAGAQAGWEIDLFGGRRAGANAAAARAADASLQWHALRTSLAAEVASTYVSLRACEAQLETVREDARSRGQTSALTEQLLGSGLAAPATAALARASAAQGRTQSVQQQAACDGLMKALVVLTAIDETALRAQLLAASARQPLPPAMEVRSVPADLLQQRADLIAASRRVEAAAFDVDAGAADRLPRVSLAGNIGLMRIESGGGQASGASWSFGPLSVTLPVFDAGTRAANQRAARAAYDDAVVQLQAQVRSAVREVEDALVQMHSVAARERDAAAATRDFEINLRATEARWRGGLGSLFELEDARRTALAARSALVELQRERAAAWISLLRALGGGYGAGDVGLARS